MFWNREDRNKKKEIKQQKKQAYDRVYELHQQAEFLCYINDVYQEKYNGEICIKLEGLIAFGSGTADDVFSLFSCSGRKKAEIEMEEMYLGNDLVERLEGGDKEVALYPKQQDVSYTAGDILCKL